MQSFTFIQKEFNSTKLSQTQNFVKIFLLLDSDIHQYKFAKNINIRSKFLYIYRSVYLSTSLRMESRGLGFLAKRSANELYPQPINTSYLVVAKSTVSSNPLFSVKHSTVDFPSIVFQGQAVVCLLVSDSVQFFFTLYKH